MATAALPTAAAEWRRYWPLVLATSAGMALAAMLSVCFGIVLEPMEQELGWSRAQISSGPFIVSMMGLVLAAPAGHLIDRFGARRCGILVVAISLVASVTIGLTDELWQWQAAWSLFGIPAAFTSTVWLAPVSTIFEKGRGMAIAITISGIGVSQTLIPPFAEYFVQNHGWRMVFIGIGVIWCAVAMVLVLAFVPKAAGTSSRDEDDPAGEAPSRMAGLSPLEGLRVPAFYLLFFASLFSAMAGVALSLNLVPVLTFTGLDRTDAVWIAGSMGIASIVGRLIGGWLMDRYDVRMLAIAASVISLTFPIGLLTLPGVEWAAIVAVFTWGLTGGMKLNAIVYLTSTYMGARSFGFFYGAISITTTVAMGVSPFVANYIYDMTQSYQPVIWAAIPGFIGAGLMFVALGPQPDFTRRS
ncbi:MAG: MFS transporter [Novosphingobium sp.]|nr:MFS transporter [Novosphingobium sp.]MCP5401005.1 MFS transporter [Novosphingobium sp.]